IYSKHPACAHVVDRFDNNREPELPQLRSGEETTPAAKRHIPWRRNAVLRKNSAHYLFVAGVAGCRNSVAGKTQLLLEDGHRQGKVSAGCEDTGYGGLQAKFFYLPVYEVGAAKINRKKG